MELSSLCELLPPGVTNKRELVDDIGSLTLELVELQHEDGSAALFDAMQLYRQSVATR